ncbi:substrate-binding periplasmic protein [Methylomonas fluvii]|uniref:Amino acid ABC transporter substrate-binding protein n=1 Tax=Methylomonas fluvii TaxID=1854564 RepID=A0ABR9DLY0_9GAMM|nr:ABC transporter substrate-binding protein [Methylomonas fluvii]MBD9363353.1 amino acid ABC transporter substrate-binding protein [Methylomonas fluvii]
MKQTNLFTVLLSVLMGAIIVVSTIRMISTGFITINNLDVRTSNTAGFGSIETSGDNSKIAYEKIIQSGVIRCGYVAYPPGLIKDPNTGEITGVFPEVLEEAAKNLGLKVEWTEEVGWGTMVEGLQTKRYDIICSPVWPLSQRAKVADFTQPIYFGGAEAYVRQGDDRFDANLEILNNSKYRIATIDGEVTEAIAQRDFPKANKLSLPQLTDISQALLSVAEKKADITFVEPFVAYDFIKTNPGKIRPARPGKPIRLYANTMMLRQDDTILRRTLDNVIDELVNNGFVDQVLRKYEPFPGAFYRRAQPFELVKSE